MDSDQNSPTSINQTYKIWKKHVPFLYNILQSYELSSPSQSVEWFTQNFIENDWRSCSILLGSNSLSQNSVSILNVGLPTDDAFTDYTVYKEERPEQTFGANGYIGTMGAQQVNTKLVIPQASEIMRARINRHDENFIAVKTGGVNPQLLVYDLKNKEELLEEKVFKLSGHRQEGFGLSWSPHQSNRLISGSYDNLILLYDVQSSQQQNVSWECSGGIEDIKWNSFNPNIFVSAHHDEKVNLWDIRSNDKKPSISRIAHSGQVYSLDFNNFNQFLLLSGGEDGDVCFWDTRNMSKKIHSFIGHNDAVNTVSWNPYVNLQFASGSSDRKIVVWDISKINQNTSEKASSEILFIHGGHRSKVTDLSWSKQKNVIASCEENIVAQVWKMNEQINVVNQ